MIKHYLFSITLLLSILSHASESNHEPTNQTAPQITTSPNTAAEQSSIDNKCSRINCFICCLMSSAIITICILGLVLWQKVSNINLTPISFSNPLLTPPPILNGSNILQNTTHQ